MKRKTLFYLTVLFFSVATVAAAQMPQGKCPMADQMKMEGHAGMMDNGGPCPGCSRGMSHGRDKGGKMDFKKMFKHKAMMMLKNADDLGLNEKQQESIRALMMSTKKDMIMKEAEIDVLDMDIMAQMMQDPVDLKAVNGLIDKKYEIKREMAKAAVNACAEMKKVLSKEQKEKMKALMKREKEEDED